MDLSLPAGSSDIRVKFCGLKTPGDIAAAAAAGAAYVGFVFFPKSPRAVDFDTAAALAAGVPEGICKVALTVDADDAMLDALLKAVPIDMLQLHGHESPDRVLELKARHGLPVMKAVGVSGPDDLAALDVYGRVADQLLVDAKAPKGADLPGGNGLAFDWRLLAGRRWPVPWILAGGLTPENLGEALKRTGAKQVDVSTGIESTRGVKDPALIARFGQAAVAA
ncbi:phosphoribosylanthranilate isomerase [Marinibacterium profundimaris]|uniref:N-(5'-phosphoribosyl)anthranilate isomerase n=1 Tax=Marinibacterium profundimaris TaxID=1679460 RepID=A0A225NDZ3_9RHOB|nr:phosphoribosylanthranilate isomerase [Marinibacterium profundimaris]OWU70530.1 N-(5'-phosphoribosyl)anthranilate isomerase [Marinibacterium profundimaris]